MMKRNEFLSIGISSLPLKMQQPSERAGNTGVRDKGSATFYDTGVRKIRHVQRNTEAS
jgi:hypothetical protein